jgi:hypothetical protein
MRLADIIPQARITARSDRKQIKIHIAEHREKKRILGDTSASACTVRGIWEELMNRFIISMLAMAAAALLCLGVAVPGAAVAQTAKDLVGTWTLVSGDSVSADGSRVPTFGAHPKGILIFTSDGRFIYLYSRADLPKFASNNRATGTPEENTAVVRGSIATYGTYSVGDKTLGLKVEHSTFPNWIGTDQKRTIIITGDELKWSNPAGSAGGVAELVLKRAK